MVALWLSSCLASLAILARDVERVQVFSVQSLESSSVSSVVVCFVVR